MKVKNKIGNQYTIPFIRISKIYSVTITYVSSSQALSDLTTSLLQKKEIAVDLEFDKNRFRYGFNLCLMQIFDGEECYLIDPLSDDIDISLIYPVLESAKVCKVVFSFGEDIRLLHSLGCFPKNIYDLSIASSLLNFPPQSLTNLLAEVISVETGKSSQQSNWFKRPLTEAQKNYAAEDVLYLLDLKASLAQQAKEKAIEGWIEQENELFASENYEDIDHNEYLKEKDKGDMSVFEWFVFSKLMELREQTAEKMNRPTYHLIDKNYLKTVACDPAKIQNWKSIPSNHKKLKTDAFIKKVSSILDNAISDARKQDLSKNKKAAFTLSKEEYQKYKAEEQRFKKLKKNIFRPIQDEIEKDFGEHTKTFILGNRFMREIMDGNFKNLLPYKKNMFEKYAEKLDIPFQELIN